MGEPKVQFIAGRSLYYDDGTVTLRYVSVEEGDRGWRRYEVRTGIEENHTWWVQDGKVRCSGYEEGSALQIEAQAAYERNS